MINQSDRDNKKIQVSLLSLDSFSVSGGGGEIRTHGPFKGSTVFKTAALNRSATPPKNR